MSHQPLIGTHVSVSGGMHTAFERGLKIGCATMQVFTKNSNQWEGKTLTDVDVQNYKTAQQKSSISPVFAHASYLINLCAPNARTLQKSRTALQDELQRCEQLGLKGLIVHPGSHVGTGEEEGIRRIAESINIAHQRTAGFRTLTVLETTAGQGTAIGYRFDQLRRIIDRVEDHSRLGVCLDTCHVFAAGYDISIDGGWETMMSAFDATIGLGRLVAVHVNDSKRGPGSRVDRHEHIGKGMIGITGFTNLMNDARLLEIPKILETDKSEDMHEDVENMAVLRSLVRT
jgi:deoxyribonuclease-4